MAHLGVEWVPRLFEAAGSCLYEPDPDDQEADHAIAPACRSAETLWFRPMAGGAGTEPASRTVSAARLIMADLVAAYINPNPHTTENSGISGEAGSHAMTITAAVQTSILNPPETSAARRLGVVSVSSAMAALQQIPLAGSVANGRSLLPRASPTPEGRGRGAGQRLRWAGE